MPLSRLGATKTTAAAVRTELARRGAPHARGLGDLRLARVATTTGDIGLACDALVMWPRPQWVVDLCGVYPLSLELTNAEDIASTDEFGSSGTAPT